MASGGNIKAGLFSAATAAAFYGVGQAFDVGGIGYDLVGGNNVYVAKTVTHGLVGGASSDLRGGSFTDGFAGAAAAQAFSPVLGSGAIQNAHPSVRVAASAAVGGTAAELSGGKFANGAVTAAFVQAFNHEGAHDEPYETEDGGRVLLGENEFGGLHTENSQFFSLNADGTVYALDSGAVNSVAPEMYFIGGGGAASALINSGVRFSRAGARSACLAASLCTGTATHSGKVVWKPVDSVYKTQQQLETIRRTRKLMQSDRYKQTIPD